MYYLLLYKHCIDAMAMDIIFTVYYIILCYVIYYIIFIYIIFPFKPAFHLHSSAHINIKLE